jgi:hypothetical protein
MRDEQQSAGDRLSVWMGDQIQMHEKAISQGGAKTFEEYREICGVIRGLRIAKNELDSMMRNWEIASELDD